MFLKKVRHIYRTNRTLCRWLFSVLVLIVIATHFLIPRQAYEGRHFDILINNRNVIFAPYTWLNLDKHYETPRYVIVRYLQFADSGDSVNARKLCVSNEHYIYHGKNFMRGEFRWNQDLHLQTLHAYLKMDEIIVYPASMQKSGCEVIVQSLRDGKQARFDHYRVKKVNGEWKIAGLM